MLPERVGRSQGRGWEDCLVVIRQGSTGGQAEGAGQLYTVAGAGCVRESGGPVAKFDGSQITKGV